MNSATIKCVFLACLFCLVTLLPVPSLWAAEGKDDRATQIVATLIEAYGGKEAISRIKSVVAKGNITDFFKDKKGRYARYYERPGRLRIEIMPDKDGEVRILDNGRGWQGSVDFLREARPVTLQSMIYQYSYLDLPMGLADGTYKPTYAGTRDLSGRSADLLEIELTGAPKLRIYVDRASHMIVRVASDFNMGMGSSELATEYKDFRPTGNVLFPIRLINYAGETKLSSILITDLTVNTPIPPELFSPPRSAGQK